MSKLTGLLSKNLRGFLWVAITAFAIYLIVRNINVFGNILLVLIGFGAVVIFHEFGHFVVAKLSDIKVEAFSIFMPPTLLGVRKVKDGFRFSILPKLFPPGAGRDDESGKSRGTRDERRETRDERRETRVGETEYRIGLIPFGGFVKMLGQDDTGPVKASDDPRSFANKPVSTRVLVIAAGVIFNVISAVIIFMTVFLIGINLPPAVVGEVVPNSPAAQAGLRPGDEVIEIAGKRKDLDFSSIMIAAALSNKGEKVPLTVRHKDGSEEEIELEAKHLPGEPMRVFGIEPPLDLTVAEVSDTNTLLENTGLLAGDRIRRVDGREVRNYWELVEIVQNTFAPTVAVEVQRASELRKCELRLDLSPAESYEVTSESDLRHIYSMVPRLRITSIVEVPERTSKFETRNSKFEIPNLKSGDIIVSINDVEYPTYKEMREVTKEHEGKELKVAVIRADANGVEETWALTVVPKRPPGGDRVLIGVGVALDAEHPVVAKTIATDDGPAKFQIPRGARIKAINGVAVSSFYDIIKEIRQYAGQRIKIDYLDGQMPGSVTLDVSGSKEIVTVKSTFAEYIPFKPLEIPYRASGPIHAITMGYRRTVMFIAQTYVTLKRLIGGAVSPKHLMGPVGIMAFSYRIVAEQPLVDYAYLLGLISAVIAVFNLLPLPPLDGGLIVLLLVEKIKGSALSERTCGIVAYAGWVLIGSLLLYLTFNDVVRNFFS